MMRARLYCLATLLGAGAIVALASTPTAMAIPECTQTGPTTIQCERPGNAQITTSPGVDNNHPWGWPWLSSGITIDIGGIFHH